MVEEDRYCIDVIRQIEAVEEALRKVRTTLLAGHLETCVTTAVRGSSAKERQRVLRELLDIYRSRRKTG